MEIKRLGRIWSWPDADHKCHKVVFDEADDLQLVYKYCRGFECVIQAGGNMGVWPWLLSSRFARVLTFEPDPACLLHLYRNLKEVKNVVAQPLALLDVETNCEIKNDRPNNLGAQYVTPGAGVLRTTTIDKQMTQLPACDLIYLDIEGAELAALRGGVGTIARFRPVIVVEDKGCSSRFGSAKGDIELWMAKAFGYRVVARPHRDVVLVPGEKE